MNPLTCTWPPILYTEYGYENFKIGLMLEVLIILHLIKTQKVMKILTNFVLKNLLHPFQTFILGQKNFPPQLATKYGIDLVFYGENEAEYGNPIADNSISLRDKSFHTSSNLKNIF